METALDVLKEGIKSLCQCDKDIERLFAPRCKEILSLLECYIKEIELFNSAYGLVGTSDTKELVIRHILDSLAPAGIFSRLLKNRSDLSPAKIADAGSGAGLPGIPLAIAMPNCDFTLIERMGRRAGFLFNTSAILQLPNITVEENELEKTAPGQFAMVTFRAFKPLEPKLLKSLLKTCEKGGIIATYKGQREKIEKEMHLLKNENIQQEIIPYNVPFLKEERHLLVIQS